MSARGRRLRIAAPIAIVALLVGAASAWAAFPQDPPNDPGYDPAEQGGVGTCSTKAADAQQHYLFAGPSQCTPGADAGASAGMNIGRTTSSPTADSAWSDFTIGNPDTRIAYIEGGINWHNGDAAELRNRVFLNQGELPTPTDPDGLTDQLSASDYETFNATAPPDANGNGVVDPEDIIVRFSDGVDDDGNGYADDISGWDFYNDQNDPATLDSTYGHANGQMKQAAAETNNGIGDAGICPRCMLIPIKAGAEALDRTDDLAQAWLYAGDIGADVIVSTTADLGYSSFMDQAVEKLWEDGVVMVESSNDFNSTDHQGGMMHPHVLPGNAVVANSHGLSTSAANASATNAATTTYNARSSYPEWGTHNMFVGATTGGTTSEATPTVGGVMSLVIAYGKEAGLTGGPLSGQEAIQVVRESATDISGNPNPPYGWEGKPGWDLQYGYGRPDVREAMEQISNGDIPPVAWIDSPDWYSLRDPTKASTVPVAGHVAAPRDSVAEWKLEFAPGAEPTEGEFQEAASGNAAADGQLGSIDLSSVPQSFWDSAQNPFGLSQSKTLETNEQYTVTIRVTVEDSQGRTGEERRAIAVHRDNSWRDGFPKEIGPGLESQPALADLQGTGKLATIFGDADGRVHALDDKGAELPGWPVNTNATQVTRQHAGVDPGHEPVLSNVAVGDLDHDGNQWVVASTLTGRVYVWDSRGNRRAGWPRALNTGVTAPAIPRPDLNFTRQPVMGASSPPVLADMDGDSRLEIVQTGWDGRIHVWRPNGSDLPGWPVKPVAPTPGGGRQLINDEKIDVPATLAELDGDNTPELVVRTQYNETPGGGLQQLNVASHLHAYNADGTPVPGWPNSFGGLAVYYGSAQEFITEGANAPSAADVDGDGRTEIVAAPGIFSPSALFETDGTKVTDYGPAAAALPLVFQLIGGNVDLLDLPDAVIDGDPTQDLPVNFTTSGAFGRFGASDTLGFAEPGSGLASVSGSLFLSGSGIPLNNYARVNDAVSGLPTSAFPAKQQGLDFLGAPVIADLTGDGRAEMVIGGDSSAMHAYNTDTGAQASGFPKFQTGWIVFGPTVGDLDSDGKVELVAGTREGYLMAWDTQGKSAANDEWWSYRHDERNTGRYGLDTRPPGALRKAKVNKARTAISFKSPGDDWYAGRPKSFQAVSSRKKITAANFRQAKKLKAHKGASAGKKVTYRLPVNRSRYVAVRAIDEAGNVGRVKVLKVGKAKPKKA
ncbi:MAG: hypothetical protein EXQ70_10505 [Solirubrobacterales bacterium]|nr:hypothetical protein [Solirubrobacterales bacterium]